MLAIAMIFALSAHAALAKPTGNCIFMCEAQPGGFGAPSGAYTQPGFGQVGNGFGQVGSGYGQAGTGFGQVRPSYGYGPSRMPTHGNLEDFGTVAVQPSYVRPAHTEVVQQQIPVQPEINGMFMHSSAKSSYEANHGFMQIHQPGVTRTVVSEPIRQPVRPARLCQETYDPCY